jgi:hypothetical protein
MPIHNCKCFINVTPHQRQPKIQQPGHASWRRETLAVTQSTCTYISSDMTATSTASAPAQRDVQAGKAGSHVVDFPSLFNARTQRRQPGALKVLCYDNLQTGTREGRLGGMRSGKRDGLSDGRALRFIGSSAVHPSAR